MAVVNRWVVLAALSAAPLGWGCSEVRTDEAQAAPNEGIHPAGMADPCSPNFHGTLLKTGSWQPMMNPDDPHACGRCHDGTPVRVPGVSFPAPGAPSCTSCHKEPGGVLACTTCHGDGRSYPPNESCFFPKDAKDAPIHTAHVQPSEAKTSGLLCSTCHPVPGPDVIGGLHGNGSVDILYDTKLVGPEASFDRNTEVCSVTCHDSGGTQPHPAWSDRTAMTCTSCHGAPPAGHYPGPCTNCHIEANATGTALTGGPLHLDGRVELGNGSGKCGACHGNGDDPWPRTKAHPAHQNPSITEPIACSSCHPVPSRILAPGHLDGVLDIAFSGLALSRGAEPVWNGSSCESVACHGANLAALPAVVPVWDDTSGAAARCGACHGVPPPDHTASTSCNRSDCHGSEVYVDAEGVPSITMTGRKLHVDGVVEP
jgi:predicted CxxxxCH...CXXCH cytochrome family protein